MNYFISSFIKFTAKYMTTTSHKGIGILYLYSGWLGGFFGFFLSIWIRLEMNFQGLAIVRKVKELNFYNHVISVHGLVMLFAFIMPVAIGGYGNLLLPVMIGSAELTMPRLNGVSYWLYFMGAVTLVIAGFFFEKPLCAGWTLYELKCINLTQCWNLQYINLLIIIIIFLYDLIINNVLIKNSLVVKMINNGQSAGFINKSSETQRQDTNIASVNRRTLKDKFFNQWLVGLVDGDGCFSISKSKNKSSYGFTFKIALHQRNIKLLYLIKKKLKYGSVTYAGRNMWQYRIRDRNHLLNLIVPIFTNYPMFTTKQYHFELFVKALNTKDCIIIDELKRQWPNVNEYINSSLDNRTPSKPYLIGFVEAEGSFYITKRNKYVHGFGLTQKNDRSLLEFIRSELGIVSKVRYNNKCFWSLDTTNKRSILNIIEYFKNAILGCKHVEFVLWSKSFNNLNIRNSECKMKDLQDTLRGLRK